jgi:hypothetical protein
MDGKRFELDRRACDYFQRGERLTRFAAGKNLGRSIACCFYSEERHRGRLGLIMAHFERIRDVISGPFSPEVIRQRMAAGWQLVSIEWRRELPESEAPTQGAFGEDIPYGLRISEDCQRLEVDPVEDRTLRLMMELLVQDFPYSSIVSDLNEKGLRMRDGRPWTRVAVFQMTPRLIEVGPRLFSTEEWNRARQRFSAPRDQEVPK